MTKLLKAALFYARRDWPVVPLHTPQGHGCSCGRPDCTSVGKHPRTRNGIKDATTNPDLIRRWWSQWPAANLGLHVSRANLVVIDIDPEHNGSIDDLPLHPDDLLTIISHTGGGGYHLLYRAPIGFEISNSNKRLPAGIDVRGVNGYIVAPPSRHTSGRCYRWRPGRAPWQTKLLSLPASLMPLLKVKADASRTPVRPPPERIRQNGERHPYVERALESELATLAQAREGQRNDKLNNAAFALGQFVGAGLLTRPEVEAMLTSTAQALGLGETEIQKTIKSGLEAGLANPRRSWPELNQTNFSRSPRR